MSKKPKIVFIKTRISFGGASISGLELLSILEGLGFEILIITGYFDEKIHTFVSGKHAVKTLVLDVMDRYYHGRKSESVRESEVSKFILDNTKTEDYLIFSQPFLGDGVWYSKVTVSISHKRRCFLRMHDPIEDKENFLRLNPNTIGIPTTQIMSNWMSNLNRNIINFVIPSVVDARFLLSTKTREELRKKYKIPNSEFLIFQPTRVSARKNISRAVILADIIKKRSDKNVSLVVAGGAERGEDKTDEKLRITKLAKNLDFRKLTFLNNALPDTVRDYIKMADLVTFFSKTESWGRIPAESCIVGTPCVTTNYTDEHDNKVFEEVYGNFDLVIEDNPHKNSISEKTIQKIEKWNKNSIIWNSVKEKNFVLAKKYDKDEWKDFVKSIFQ